MLAILSHGSCHSVVLKVFSIVIGHLLVSIDTAVSWLFRTFLIGWEDLFVYGAKKQLLDLLRSLISHLR